MFHYFDHVLTRMSRCAFVLCLLSMYCALFGLMLLSISRSVQVSDPPINATAYRNCLEEAFTRYDTLHCAVENATCFENAARAYYTDASRCAENTTCHNCFSTIGGCKDLCVCRPMTTSECIQQCVTCMKTSPAMRKCCPCIQPWTTLCDPNGPN